MKKWFKYNKNDILIFGTAALLSIASVYVIADAVEENKKQKQKNPEWKSKLEEALFI